MRQGDIVDISVAETIFITSLLVISMAITYYYTSSLSHYENLIKDVNVYRIRTVIVKTIYSLMLDMAEGLSSKETAYLFLDDNVFVQTRSDGLIILYRSRGAEVRGEELLEMAVKIFNHENISLQLRGEANSIAILIVLEKTQSEDGILLTLSIE